jgi:autotransporter family porin
MRSSIRVLACAVLASGLGLVGTTNAAKAAPNPVQPQRVLDTRINLGHAGRLLPGEQLALAIPAAAGATSVVLNLTADQAQGPGFVIAWPCGTPMPNTSILNVVPGQAVANLILVNLPAAGVCFATSTPTHLIADLNGSFTGTGDITSIVPNRIVDTRFAGTPLAAGVERQITIANTPGIPASASVAALNITVTGPVADGFLVAYPCGSTPPNASTVNFRAGEDRPNFTVVLLASGKVCLRSSVATGVIVDSFGWSANTGGLRALNPARIIDTRQTASYPYGVPVSPGTPLALRIADKGGVPNDASAALLTITVDNAPSSGFVTAWPCDLPQPNASTLNLFQGVLRSNLAMVKLSAVAGTVCIAVSTVSGAPVHLIVDAVGSLTGGPARSAPPADPPPPTSSHFSTLPPGSALPSDAQCTAAVRHAPEVRPQNTTTNAKAWHGGDPDFPRSTGSFTGTTDEIIQWVACKWGIDEDIARAQVAKESWWKQSNLGDWTTDSTVCPPGHPIGADGTPGQCPESVGLMQVRTRFFRGSIDGALASSSYNLDVSYAVWRNCYEGKETWLNDVEHNGTYGAGDVWGCVGRWFSGRWHTAPSEGYITAVKDYLSQKIWTTPNFVNDHSP